MKPAVKEFQDDTELMAEVRRQASNGISKHDLYVISHDDDRTERVADAVDANEPDDLNELVGTRYTKKGEELRAILEEFDFSSDEASNLEDKLDHGKILLLIKT